MNGTTLLAAQRAPALIDREQELETIRRAIYQPQTPLEIVLIRGAGGMGKSRLVEEVLWRGGNGRARQSRHEHLADEQDWTKQAPAIVSDIIDMNNIALHSRTAFMHAVRDALIWEGSGIRFPNYDAAYGEFLRQRVMQGDYTFLKELEERAEKSFFDDYRQNAERQRLVLVLDTIEKLYPIGGTRLLLEAGLLETEDIAFYTYHWLLQQIEQNRLPNTTLLLVGRGEEGKEFFEEIAQVAGKNPQCKVTPLDIGPFSLENTRTYFKILAADWQKRAQENPQLENIAQTITNIATDEERTEIIWIYTGGQPVRLALYTDLIVEDWTIPAPFQKTLEEARQAQTSEQELEQARREIEAGFIRLLFGGAHPRAHILQALVRAPRGLDAEQLHYLLTSNPEQTVEDWQKHGSNGAEITLPQIEKELESLRNLALVKIRPDGRLGLQDEIYRIYARALSGEEHQRKAESEARQKLYRQLADWAKHKHQEYLREVIAYQAQDESLLNLGRPSDALKVSFPHLSLRDQQRRDQARAFLQHWELEYLHYAVLSDFRYNFNHLLFEIGDEKLIAN
ncbi:MAG: ATP-binding protein, partial [Anaerolineales bacterium]